jgi:hypothetical protein
MEDDLQDEESNTGLDKRASKQKAEGSDSSVTKIDRGSERTSIPEEVIFTRGLLLMIQNFECVICWSCLLYTWLNLKQPGAPRHAYEFPSFYERHHRSFLWRKRGLCI